MSKREENKIDNIRSFEERQKTREKELFRIKLIFFLFACLIIIFFFLNVKKTNDGDDSYTAFQTIEEASVSEKESDTLYGNPATDADSYDSGSAYDAISKYADSHGFDVSDYPDKLFELYEKNPEARQFVLEYPEKKDISHDIDLSEYSNCTSVPLLLQWDERWGYSEYSGTLFGLSGCGPTCLSMAAIYLLGDTSMNPLWMSGFAKDHGYSVDGSGSAWTLISEGGKELGMQVNELSLSEEIMAEKLNQGSIIICIMGPGDFTDTGHFIVLTGYSEEGFSINDPNSPSNSSKLWSYDELYTQIRCLWELSE